MQVKILSKCYIFHFFRKNETKKRCFTIVRAMLFARALQYAHKHICTKSVKQQNNFKK
jgi:hypothetical protein